MTDAVRGEVEQWARRPELLDLVLAFHGDVTDIPDETGARLAWLDQFSDRWDTRQGKERDQASSLDLTPSQQATVFEATAGLRMRQQSLPTRPQYDLVMILGGLIRACFVRPAYAAQLIESQTVQASGVVALGGHRPFSEEETELAARSGHPQLADEFSALDQGVRTAFLLDGRPRVHGVQSDVVGQRWTVHEYAGPTPVTVAAAPSREPGVRRANTADAYAWYAQEWAPISPGATVLAVTTPLYVPAQHAAAQATLGLPFGVHVETIGTAPAEGIWAQDFTPSRYLMEVRSAIRAHRTLWQSLSAQPGSNNAPALGQMPGQT